MNSGEMNQKGRRIRRIGVFGVHPAAGATHLTMLAAAYFSHCQHRLTEVFSKDGKDDFRDWQTYITGRTEQNIFRTRRCIYHVKAEEAEKLENMRTEVVVCDFGHEACLLQELLECEDKWVIGSSGIFCVKHWNAFWEQEVIRTYIKTYGLDSFSFFLNHSETGKQHRVPVPPDFVRKPCGTGLGTEKEILIPSKNLKRVFQKITGCF